jgi:hypothetical protein
MIVRFILFFTSTGSLAFPGKYRTPVDEFLPPQTVLSRKNLRTIFSVEDSLWMKPLN